MSPRTMFTPLGPRHFAVIAAVLLLVILVLLSLAWPRLAKEYVLAVDAPPLEAEFGFHAEYIPVGEPESRCRVYAITALDSQGRLSQAGFREGDWLSTSVCKFYGDYVAAQAFLADLRRVQEGEAVEFVAYGDENGHRDYRRFTVTPTSH